MKLISAVFLTTFAAVALSAPSVTIDSGTIDGGKCAGGPDAVFYKAIPYAEPPVGELRFEPPKAYKAKFPRGKIDATMSAPTCIQFSDDFTPTKLNSSALSSEDCLYLDVWAPSSATTGSNLPVKVWVYGGSETEGSVSDPLYDGCNTADAGSILVTINYRLGPLGFTALSSAGIYGNQGIQDILLGLQWVQENIAAFGGDPKKVLLFGQSAGAENVYIIGSLPQAPDLVNSIISESGGGRSLVSNATQQRVAASYSQVLKCSPYDKACLQSKTVSDLQRAYSNDIFLTQGVGYYGALGVTSPKSHVFYPYVDGNVIPKDPYDSGVNVPTVFGSNSNEGTVYAIEWAASNLKKGIEASPSIYKDFLRRDFGDAASLVGKYYKPADFEAYAAPIAASGKLPGYNTTSLAIVFAMSQVVTDSTYKCPAWYGAVQAMQKNIPTWTYEFQHSPSCSWLSTIPQKAVSFFGSTHTAEIPYVFGNLDNDYIVNGTCNSTSAEYSLSRQMMNAWSAMAENAVPSTKDISWPQFASAKNLSTPGMIFGKSSVPGMIDYSVCDVWTEVNAILSAGNVTTTGTPTSRISSPTSSSTSSPTFNAAANIPPTRQGIAVLGLLVMGSVTFT
ncbi:alpha/beta-hydrolase [Penicillium antarcticum]|uniref:alpha/beta-hydrolase n=1 Tax=Penicillium antarcticum TaxID=416450 RepID=UPI0023A7390D|nr:alpha/beta-hydrolase [Penicillium antarcticum]KAJ5316489.1 alpha/beta-hydrolase [Penicillium antarcticum]